MKLFIGFLAGLFFFGTAGLASATILDFEGTGTGELGSYGGFTWANMYSYNYSGYNSSYSNTLSPVSGTQFAYNPFGTSASIADGDAFDFVGAYFTGWLHSDAESFATAHSVTIQGYNSGALVDTFVANLTIGVMNYFDVGMKNVDQVVFTTDGDNRWFLMDDFSFNRNASVPEPSTMFLFCFGILGLAGVNREKQ